MIDISVLFEERKYRRNAPRTGFDFYALSVFYNARNVFVKPAAGDMTDAVNIAFGNNFENRLYVYFGW
jgi:hypothetical protein